MDGSPLTFSPPGLRERGLALPGAPPYLLPSRLREGPGEGGPAANQTGSSRAMGTPGAFFELRTASADLTTLTFGAAVSRVVRKR